MSENHRVGIFWPTLYMLSHCVMWNSPVFLCHRVGNKNAGCRKRIARLRVQSLLVSRSFKIIRHHSTTHMQISVSCVFYEIPATVKFIYRFYELEALMESST